MRTNFANNEILNSALLVDMVYIEERKLKHIRDLEKKIIKKNSDKILNLTKEYGFENINDFNSEYYIKDLVDHIWENLKEKIEKSDDYKKITRTREFLYEKKKFKTITIDSETETDIKRALVDSLIKELQENSDDKKIPFGLEEYYKMGVTSIDLENVHNKKLAEIRDENKNLWSKFKPLEISEEIVTKYSKNFDVKTAFGLKASFENGYVDIGVDGLEKDTSFMVGYIKNDEGEDVLNIVFRGTEDKSMDTLKYMTNRYPNMERQYHRLEPILADILKQEKEKNPKLKVIFTGHSLGASLAEKALSKHKDNADMEFKAILIANPGSFHYLQSLMNKLDEWHNTVGKHKVKSSKFKILGCDAIREAKNAALGFTIMSIMLGKVAITTGTALANYARGSIDVAFKPITKDDSVADKIMNYSTFYAAKFVAVGVSSLVATSGEILAQLGSPFIEKRQADPRSLTINHKNDPIPAFGKALFQNSNNQYVELVKDHTSYELGLAGNQLIFHKTFNYFLELKELAQKGNIFTPKQDLNVDDKKSIINRIREMKESLFNNKQLNMSPKLT